MSVFLCNDADVSCEVVKFWDRIWLKEESAKIVREINLKVDGDESLDGFSMIIPTSSVTEEKIITSTALDRESSFNKGKKLGYKIVSEEEKIVNNDGFEETRILTGRIETQTLGNDLVQMKVELDNKIKPGATGMIRLSFRIPSPLEQVTKEIYKATFSYFSSTIGQEQIELLDVDKLEIPVNPIVDLKDKKGGFDVVAYLPPEWEAELEEEEVSYAEGYLTPEGKKGEMKDAAIWRARELADPDTLLKNGENLIFDLRVRSPVIWKKLEDMSKKTWIAIIVAVISVIIASLALMI